MIIAGLTGSIAMGKSTVAAMFVDEGIPVFDADAVVHGLQGPHGALLTPIENAFPGTTSAAGVDRIALGKAVFGSRDKLVKLEDIVHPAVVAEREAFLRNNHVAPLLVLDIPLLLEKGRPPSLDVVIVVSARPEQQRKRALSRPGMTLEKFDRILAMQMPDAEKRNAADYVVSTACSLDHTRARVREVISCLMAGKGR